MQSWALHQCWQVTSAPTFSSSLSPVLPTRPLSTVASFLSPLGLDKVTSVHLSTQPPPLFRIILPEQLAHLPCSTCVFQELMEMCEMKKWCIDCHFILHQVPVC